MNMNPDEKQRKYMGRALQLARKGFPWTSPNPMVGAVIVSEDNLVIGEGYHRICGGPHAEVNAIATVKDEDMLRTSTMYVTLEPCAHTGRTGPCAKLIIDKGIQEIVIGCRDPFEKVDGRGIEMLLDAGIKVDVGVMENDCRRLNAVFFTAHTLHRPFVTLKWAQTADGFLDSDRSYTAGKPLKISSPLTSVLMHRLRAQYDGIIVGSGTVMSDNPMLDTRLWPGRSPHPIIMDRRGRISAPYKIMARDPMIIRDDINVSDLLQRLYSQGYTSILVEGGAEVLNTFIDSGIWDLARVEIGDIRIRQHGKVTAPSIGKVIPAKTETIGRNIVNFYINNPLIDVKNL